VLTVRGTRASDRIALRLKAGDPGTLRVDFGDNGSADFRFDRAAIARIVVEARAGDDVLRMEESNGVFTDTIPTTLDGGRGEDQLSGGRGAELLLGRSGNDSIDGNQGNDLALMGAGDDTFVWDPGDGSDTVEGQDGADRMRFNGANIAERIELSANGPRLRFTRDIGNITMDTDGVEQVDFNALGAVDLVTVHDLSGTDVTRVNVDESNPAGSGLGDGAADGVVVEGTNGGDVVSLEGSNGSAR
jgi:RTX calcium-binding nonapeptide repeat (4 copies)